MSIDLKARLTNKGFWVALISAIVGVTQLLGYKIFADNWADILNSILGILVIMGVVIDPSTPGISDNKGGQ
jgi:phi LC3 family holin